jgi:PAS domain S-box-containing protein
MKFTESRYFRFFVSILFGVFGFGLNFLDIQLIESPDFKVNILVGLIFPLMITLAWGWRYGLLSALAGGCQSMWWLWYSDGWGFLYAVPVFFLWIVWHGWWAERRYHQKSYPMYQSCFIVEIPFRIIVELGFYTIFRWLVSNNPPPWDGTITWNYVSLEWVHLVVVKHVITGYLLLLAAYTALSFHRIRAFFGLEPEPAQRDISAIYSTAFLLGFAIWIIDSIIVTFLYNPDHKSFWENAFLNIEQDRLLMRIVFICVSLIGAVLFARIVREKEVYQKRLLHLNMVLRAIRNVNQLITIEKDRKRLIDSVCKELVNTRGCDSAWVVLIDEDGNPSESAQVGIGERFDSLIKLIREGYQPHCWQPDLTKDALVIIEEPSKTCLDDPIAFHYQDQSALGVRLSYEGNLFGYLVVSNAAENINDKEEQLLFKEIAGDISFALSNINLLEEKEKADIALRESEERFRVIFDSAPMSISLVRDGKYLFVNPAAARLLGYQSVDELCDMNVLDTIAPEFHHMINSRVKKIDQGDDNPLIEMQVLRSNGERVWTTSISASVKIDGKTTAVIVGQDISALKAIEQQIKLALREKETLLQELYHRTKNNMQVIYAMLALRSSYFQSEQLQAILNDMQNKIHAMSLVHQKLYESKDLSRINLKEYFYDLFNHLHQSFCLRTRKIGQILDLEDVYVVIDIAIPCGLIISELLSNAYKYAFPDEREGIISIHLHRQDDENIKIQIADNGVGLSSDFEIKESDSLGLEMVYGIVEHQLRGEISFKVDHGLKWELHFMDHLYEVRV